MASASSSSSEQNPDSTYATLEYWEQLYAEEAHQFEEAGLMGDEWYSSYQNAVLSWLDEHWEEWQGKKLRLCGLRPRDRAESLVLDVGTGNGLFLHHLSGLGFNRFIGTDIIPKAVELARTLWKSNQKGSEDATFCVDDLLTVSGTWETSLQVDLLHDKGTLDVFVLQKRAGLAVDAMLRRFTVPGTVALITSGNLTEEELVEMVTHGQHSTRRFIVLDRMKKGVPKFTFGGLQGSVVATAAFLVVAKKGNDDCVSP